MRPYAESLGYAGEPFAWNEERRFRCGPELTLHSFSSLSASREKTEPGRNAKRKTPPNTGS